MVTDYSPGLMTDFYTENGLFAKIVDMPAEDASLKGFELEGISRAPRSYYRQELDRLNWPEAASTALKWQRLYGGAIVVMFADDGRGLEDPLDLERVRSVDGLQVFDSSVIQVELDAEGEPVSFTLNSKRACCTVHPSRCLLFRSDPLPEKSGDPAGEFWGSLLYHRIEKALQDVIVSHGYAPKMLQNAGGSVLKVPGLSEIMATEQGENRAIGRLQALNMLRGMFSTIIINPDEDFKVFPLPETMTRIAALINGTWIELAACTGIPPDILIGQHVELTEGQMKGTWKTSGDQSPKELYASFIRGIQEDTLKTPLLRLLEIIGRAGVASGKLRTVEPVCVKWKPLYEVSELEAAENALTKARTDQTRADTIAAQLAAGIITRQEAARIIKEKKM